MEIWDAYDRDGTPLGFDIVRGETVPAGVYHLVGQILVRHADGDFLLMQRDPRKPILPGYFEATAGGAILKGETPEAGSRRELLEETGIDCPDLRLMDMNVNERKHGIYYTYFCAVDIPKDCVTLQEGETVAYRWVSEDEADAMFAAGEVVPAEVWRIWKEYKDRL